MAPIDIVVLVLIGIAFAAVCVRMYRKGSCADCAQGGYCTGHCSNGKKGAGLFGRKKNAAPATCAALKGVDKVAEELSRGVK